MKIYTRTGDRGETGLFGGQRVRKDHVRVDAYGEVDELNSVLGLAAARLAADGETEIRGRLREIQTELFTIGANLATPRPEDGGRASSHIPAFAEARIAEMEGWIDDAETQLEPLKTFILPGGSEAAALLHLARTVCRRAERRVVSLAHEAHIEEGMVIYLNRLSDLLFTLARLANHRDGIADIPWVTRTEPATGNGG
ncbi:MAG: cob(I)yrinic acid a,c-diamide adenosyltransferase [Gemmatimonadetes bacterium]|nr:cob(I)yrinic acid a,c-diamide adenosyltransferase [Gemmatimonadota bacterium]